MLFIVVQKLLLAHCSINLEVVIDNVGSCLWQVVGHIMVASWNEKRETYASLIWQCYIVFTCNAQHLQKH
jgi:hypothetical protein